jgi:hypothetical protein
VTDAVEERELPFAGRNVVPQDVSTVGRFQLEVPVIGRQPAVEDRVDVDDFVTQPKTHWCFLAAIAGVAFNRHGEQPVAHTGSYNAPLPFEITTTEGSKSSRP